jgi:hypothetical protein
MSKRIIATTVLALSVLVMAACATAAPAEVAEEAAPAEAAAGLTLSGVASMTWSAEDLAAMPQTEADYTDKEGATTTFSGVSFSELLTAAGVTDYASVTMVAADGYSAEVTADELSACANCIVAVDEDGSFRSVMPDLGGKLNVKGLVELQVK